MAGALGGFDPLDRRNRISDVLLNYAFHVFDISFQLPNVFTLAYGFKFCTAPEVTINDKQVKEGTFEYPRHLAVSAEVSDITLERGASFFDSDFYDWVTDAIRAKQKVRKNLLLVQYSQIEIGSLAVPGNQQSALGLAFDAIKGLVSRVPARAWILIDCLPTHYKSGTDFDAQGPDVSLMNLTIKPWYFEEISLGL